ncbi:hypothetical protein GCM10008171_12690 [Methylopila jiangsuensis]|uniref:DUF4381 domain-containing protein n=1 Tax=Methylopila jiangsuensis TaxID=586230 RepID=A0A9W6N366_9HYPH|nr:DUF4381 family protein [Methylopila jiangsuensis]MDR6286252.1 hypothetical protein [Methylopila jiangsuensis]GLK76015.1 hypothetical protein GCM10008171_12690 [Methylopila jiangsuensis]
MPPADELDGLRGLHLPPLDVPFWSDVWLAVALGLALALAASLLLRRLMRPRPALRAAALAAFDKTLALPPPERRAAQAALLRRVTRAQAGDAAAAAHGADWAATLDRLFGGDLFSAGPGRVFGDGLYARDAARDDAELDARLRLLLARLPR